VVGVDSYFFPEGQAAHFDQARYGEYRVSPLGQDLLLRLVEVLEHAFHGDFWDVMPGAAWR